VLQTLSLVWMLSTGEVCGPVDLDTALELAAANGDEVAVRRAEVAAAEADLALARAARIIPIGTATLTFGPSPEAHGTVTDPIAGSSRNPFGGLSVFGRIDVNVAEPLFTWGRLDAAQAAARAGLQARNLLLEDTTSQVQLRVIQLFWGEALAHRLLDIAAEVEKKLPDVEKRIKNLIDEGSSEVKLTDRYRLDIYKAQLRRRESEATKGLTLAHDGLAALVAAAPEELKVEPVPLPGSPPTEVAALGEAQRAAEHQRPDVAALDEAILARQAEVKATRAAMLPQVFLGGVFAYSYAPNRDIQTNPWVGDYFNTLAFGVGLSIRQDLAFPLLTSQLDKVEAEEATLQHQRQGLARLVAVQVESAVADLADAAEHFRAAGASYKASKSWERSAGLDFEAGVGEAKDLIDSYTAYVENEVDLAQATFELLVARARFDQVTGVAPKKGVPPCRLP
jgi:outer membrane protein TolC